MLPMLENCCSHRLKLAYMRLGDLGIGWWYRLRNTLCLHKKWMHCRHLSLRNKGTHSKYGRWNNSNTSSMFSLEENEAKQTSEENKVIKVPIAQRIWNKCYKQWESQQNVYSRRPGIHTNTWTEIIGCAKTIGDWRNNSINTRKRSLILWIQ